MLIYNLSNILSMSSVFTSLFRLVMCRALTDRAGKRACSQLIQADTLCLRAAPVLVQGRHRLVRRLVGGGMPGGCGSVFSWRWLDVLFKKKHLHTHLNKLSEYVVLLPIRT